MLGVKRSRKDDDDESRNDDDESKNDAKDGGVPSTIKRTKNESKNDSGTDSKPVSINDAKQESKTESKTDLNKDRRISNIDEVSRSQFTWPYDNVSLVEFIGTAFQKHLKKFHLYSSGKSVTVTISPDNQWILCITQRRYGETHVPQIDSNESIEDLDYAIFSSSNIIEPVFSGQLDYISNIQWESGTSSSSLLCSTYLPIHNQPPVLFSIPFSVKVHMRSIIKTILATPLLDIICDYMDRLYDVRTAFPEYVIQSSTCFFCKEWHESKNISTCGIRRCGNQTCLDCLKGIFCPDCQSEYCSECEAQKSSSCDDCDLCDECCECANDDDDEGTKEDDDNGDNKAKEEDEDGDNKAKDDDKAKDVMKEEDFYHKF